MKKIGLIGGVGWPSTVDYYKIINEECNRHFGDLTSPEIIIYSVNFQPLFQLQHANDLQQAANYLAKGALALEKAGADMILICSATTNIAAELVQPQINIPIIGLAETTAKAIREEKINSVLLLGTNITMENNYFSSWLNKYDINCIVPELKDRQEINRIIYDELCFNKILPKSKSKYLEIIAKWSEIGKVQGVILGCTEIPLLIDENDLAIKTFDITRLHALESFKIALQK